MIWHFISESGYEDYAGNEEERDAFLALYLEHYCPFTVDKEEDNDDGEEDDYSFSSLSPSERNPSLR